MHVIISDSKTGKSYKAEVSKDKEMEFAGKKIGDAIDGGTIGAAGYELELTGGSDDSGFPMRSDVTGTRKIGVLLTKGVGYNAKEKGMRRKKVVRGNAYSQSIVQVNAKIVKEGPVPLGELFKTEKKEEKK